MKEYSLEQALTLLVAEAEVLHKLLYRNHNQHGASRLFNYLKRVDKTLAFLPKEAVLRLSRTGEAVLRLKTTVTGSDDVAQRLACLADQQRALACCLECLFFCSKAVDICKQQLAAQLFVPLFTILLAVCARLTACLGSILMQLQAQQEALLRQLSNACLMSPKYQLVMATGMRAAALSAQQTLQVEALVSKGRARPAADATSSSAVQCSSSSNNTTATSNISSSSGSSNNSSSSSNSNTSSSSSAPPAAPTLASADDEGVEVGAEAAAEPAQQARPDKAKAKARNQQVSEPPKRKKKDKDEIDAIFDRAGRGGLS